MARTRANLDAKRQLADQIDSQISSRMEDFLQSIGTGENEQIKQQSEIITKNVTVEAQLAGYKQKKTEVQNIGSKFQIYVLLEYPIGKANQILINQIKQDENLSTQDAADAALAALSSSAVSYFTIVENVDLTAISKTAQKIASTYQDP